MDVLFLSLFLLALSAVVSIFIVFELCSTIIADLMGAPYLRSGKKRIQTMMELAELKPGEVAVDLGSGDGSVLLEAARRGARAQGVEFNPFFVRWSRARAKKQKLDRLITVHAGDFRMFPLGDADVIFLYLLPKTLAKLADRFSSELKPGSRIVSNAFRVPGWTSAREKDNVYLYLPAQKSGAAPQ